jgi:hypothetical protein
MEPYLVGGWSKSFSTAGRSYRFTTDEASTVLVPNLMPHEQNFTLWVAPAGAREVTIEWNGDVVSRRTLDDGWTAIKFPMHGELHTNEITVKATPGVFAGADMSSPGARPVGVAVSDLEIQLVRE